MAKKRKAEGETQVMRNMEPETTQGNIEGDCKGSQKQPKSTEISAIAMDVVEGGHKSAEESTPRERASIALNAKLNDATGTSEGLQDLYEMLVSSNPKAVESEEKVLSLNDLTAGSENQPSDEDIIDDLKRDGQRTNTGNSESRAESGEIDFELRDENKDLLRWLETELLQLQQARTHTQKQILYLTEEMQAIDNDMVVIVDELWDLKDETPAELIAVEAKARELEEEAASLHKAQSEFEKMFKEKVVEVSRNLGKWEDNLLENEGQLEDGSSPKIGLRDVIYGKVGEIILTELYASDEELRTEKAAVQTLSLEKEELMHVIDSLIMRFFYMDTLILIMRSNVEMLPEMSVEYIQKEILQSIQDHHAS